MENKPATFWSVNTPFGLLMGGCFILASWLSFRQSNNIYANPALDRIITFLYVIGLFLQIRRFRESPVQQGYISYGGALKTGVYLSLIIGVVYGIYSVFIYSAHPEMLQNYLTTVQAAFQQLYPESPLGEKMSEMLTLFTTPYTMGFSEFLSKIILGSVYSLVIAAFLRKSRPKPFSSENRQNFV